MRNSIRVLVIAALSAGSTLAAQQPALVLAPCTAPNTTLAARCGTLEVPERRDKHGSGRTIALRVVLIPATGATPAADAIVPIPGGPGAGVTGNGGGWARILSESRAERAILLVDPRGTGESGALDCDLDNPHGHLGGYFRDFMPLDLVKACRSDLEKRVDLTAYSTESIADDLEAVRAALGIPSLDLYGVSGGTRQAQVYLARYPARVRTMVLGGVLAPGFRMPIDYARDSQAAFDSVAAACRADSACQKAYPRFRQDFDTVLSRLESRPRHVVLPRPDGIVDTVTITRDIFAEQVRTRFYNPFNAAALPWIVSRAIAEDFLPFAETIVPGWKIQDPDGIAMGHFLAITCTEDLPGIKESEIPAATNGTFLRDYRVRQQKAGCVGWPRATLSAGHFTPVRHDVPTLFISGDADPVTPPHWAEAAAKYLPNSLSLVWHGGGHVPFADACAGGIASRFIATASTRGLETGCISQYRRPPFVIK